MKRALQVLVAAALLAGVTPTATARSQAPESVPRVRVAIGGYENNMTPFTLTFGALPYTHDLIHLVYDSLFWSQVKEKPEPWLAEKAEPSDDFKEWTVTLREGVKWHDGQPLTSEDVKFSFDYYQKTPGASGRYAHHVGDQPPYERSEVVDEQTLKVFFKAAAPIFEIMPGADLPIVPKHIWEKVTEPTKASADLPVGSGPYKVVEMVPDQRYRLQANADYFQGKPVVDELELPIVRDPAAAFAALRSGEVDSVARNIPAELVDQFTKASDIEVAKGTKFESTQLYFNARKPPLDNASLRKAISLAIDNKALVDTVLLGQGRPGRDTYVHPDSPWAVTRNTHEHDPAAANKMLDEAGFTTKDSDGVRKTADGKRLEFSVLVSSFAPQELRAIQLIAQQVAPIGVKLTPEALDPATLRQRRNPPAPGQAPTYDAYTGGLEAHGHVDPDALYYFFHSPGPKGFGASITGYTNPEFDSLVEKATTLEPADRKPVLYDAQELLAKEAPIVVLWYSNGLYAYRTDKYDGWVNDFGQGVFSKRSFLPEYVEEARAERESAEGDNAAGGTGSAAADDDGGGNGALIVALVGVGVFAVLVGAGVARRRRTAGEDDE